MKISAYPVAAALAVALSVFAPSAKAYAGPAMSSHVSESRPDPGVGSDAEQSIATVWSTVYALSPV